jgi:hypothetical protein
MKKINGLLIIISLLLVVACDHKTHYKSVVKILPDGSCYREFADAVDSAFMVGDTANSPFPVILDSAWKVSWTYSASSPARKYNTNWPLKQWVWDKDTSKHLELEAKIRRDYPSVEAMSKTFTFERLHWKGVTPRIKFEKKFRWFFTFYSYSETYPQYHSLKRVPIEKFLTRDEINMYLGDNPKFPYGLNGQEIRDILNGIDAKVEDWLNKTFFEEYYGIIKKDLPYIKGLKIDSIRFSVYKDSVYKSIKDTFDKEPGKFLKNLDNYYKVKVFAALPDSSVPYKDLKRFKDSFEYPFTVKLDYNLILPGKLIDASSKQTHGDTTTLNVNLERFYFKDYTIRAESRVANIWAFVISGVFIIGVVLSFFIKRKA